MVNVIVSDELIKKFISSGSYVIHAHWIKGTFCGFWIRVSDSKMVYCPHCGAKMDEQQNDIEDTDINKIISQMEDKNND